MKSYILLCSILIFSVTTSFAQVTLDNTSTTQFNICQPDGLTPYKKQSVNIISENDAYYNTFTDRYYTAGNRIGYTSKEYDYYCQNLKYEYDNSFKPSKLAWLGKISLMKGEKVTKWSIELAQEMYTPKMKRAPVEGEPDYPYAGYLYLSFALTHRNADTEERMKVQLGIVGPASLAQYTQDFIHQLGFGGKLQGWDSQLYNEPIINLYYQVTKKFYIFDTKYFSADILPSGSVALGNANTFASLGTRLRLGYNLESDFGPSKINHFLDSSTPHDNAFSIYIFGGVSGRFVVKNIFISGNTFQKGTNLDIQRFVYDLEGGVAILFQGFRLSYTFSHRSKEFLGQANNMNFSSIALQIAF